MKAICSLLFAPAHRPDRFAKAIAAAPDVVCFDLEDSVGESDKDEARKMLYEHAPWAAAGRGASSSAAGESSPLPPAAPAPGFVVRINSPRTPAGLRDLLAAIEAPVPPPALMIPKVETSDELRMVADVLSHARRPGSGDGGGDGGKAGIALHALIETAAGVARAPDILGPAGGGAGLFGAGLDLVLFGAVDLAADVGCRAEDEDECEHSAAAAAAAASPFLQYARARVVMAAAAAGGGGRRPALLDSPCLRLGDADALRAECERARGLGFSGKAAIHPAQLGIIHEVFVPTAAEVERAERIMRAYASSRGAAVALDDGTVVEAPVVKRAQAVLERARRAGT